MAKFTITVCCDVPMCAQIEVEADNELDAKTKALKLAPLEDGFELDYDGVGPYYVFLDVEPVQS